MIRSNESSMMKINILNNTVSENLKNIQVNFLITDYHQVGVERKFEIRNSIEILMNSISGHYVMGCLQWK
jgi:hypothetical protein